MKKVLLVFVLAITSISIAEVVKYGSGNTTSVIRGDKTFPNQVSVATLTVTESMTVNPSSGNAHIASMTVNTVFIASASTFLRGVTFEGSSVTVQGDFVLDTSTMMVGTTLTIATGTTIASTRNDPSIFIATHGGVGFRTNNVANDATIHVMNYRALDTLQRWEDKGNTNRLLDLTYKDNFTFDTINGHNIVFAAGGTSVMTFGLSGAYRIINPGLTTTCGTVTPNQLGAWCAQSSATCPLLVSTGTAAGDWACVSITGKP